VNVIVKTYPAERAATEQHPGRPAGFYVLRSLPNNETLAVNPFKEGGFSELMNTHNYIKKTYGCTDEAMNEKNKILTDWKEFVALAPSVSTVYEFYVYK